MATAKLYNLARMTTATTGTGTITLGSAVSGFLSFAAAGVANGEVVTYAIRDGGSSEIGRGTYTASGTTLTRSVLKSTNSDAAINLSGAAEVYITAAKEDFDYNDFTAETAIASGDKFPFYDVSAAAKRAASADNIVAGLAATQAEQEAGSVTNRIVTPGRQHYHPSAVKAWVKFQGDGTVTINDDYGVSTIGDGGTGEYVINLDASFENANYAGAAIGRRISTDATEIVTICVHRATAPTTSAFRIVTLDETNNRLDVREVHVHICGNLP